MIRQTVLICWQTVTLLSVLGSTSNILSFVLANVINYLKSSSIKTFFARYPYFLQVPPHPFCHFLLIEHIISPSPSFSSCILRIFQTALFELSFQHFLVSSTSILTCHSGFKISLQGYHFVFHLCTFILWQFLFRLFTL